MTQIYQMIFKMEKTCTKCGVTKSIEEFYIVKGKHVAKCKQCFKKDSIKWAEQEHPPRIKIEKPIKIKPPKLTPEEKKQHLYEANQRQKAKYTPEEWKARSAAYNNKRRNRVVGQEKVKTERTEKVKAERIKREPVIKGRICVVCGKTKTANDFEYPRRTCSECVREREKKQELLAEERSLLIDPIAEAERIKRFNEREIKRKQYIIAQQKIKDIEYAAEEDYLILEGIKVKYQPKPIVMYSESYPEREYFEKKEAARRKKMEILTQEEMLEITSEEPSTRRAPVPFDLKRYYEICKELEEKEKASGAKRMASRKANQKKREEEEEDDIMNSVGEELEENIIEELTDEILDLL